MKKIEFEKNVNTVDTQHIMSPEHNSNCTKGGGKIAQLCGKKKLKRLVSVSSRGRPIYKRPISSSENESTPIMKKSTIKLDVKKRIADNMRREIREKILMERMAAHSKDDPNGSVNQSAKLHFVSENSVEDEQQSQVSPPRILQQKSPNQTPSSRLIITKPQIHKEVILKTGKENVQSQNVDVTEKTQWVNVSTDGNIGSRKAMRIDELIEQCKVQETKSLGAQSQASNAENLVPEAKNSEESLEKSPDLESDFEDEETTRDKDEHNESNTDSNESPNGAPNDRTSEAETSAEESQPEEAEDMGEKIMSILKKVLHNQK